MGVYNMTKQLYLTANDTWPTTITVTGVDITTWVIKMEIAYTVPLVKTATNVDALNGVCAFNWIAGDLVAGTWLAHITFTDGGGKKLTTQDITLNINTDFTP